MEPPAPSPGAQTAVLPRVLIGTEEAAVEFSRLAPGYVGWWQVNALIPDVASVTGQMPLVIITPQGNASNAATVWVEQAGSH